MCPSYTRPDRPRVLFADSRLVADGLLLPATLAARLGLRQSAQPPRRARRRARRRKFADKGLTVVMSTLAGGDCIDDVAALRAGAMAAVLGQRVATAGRSAAARSSQRKIGQLCDQ